MKTKNDGGCQGLGGGGWKKLVFHGHRVSVCKPKSIPERMVVMGAHQREGT